MLWGTSTNSLTAELQQKNVDISLLCRVFGHSARIFRCQILKNSIITAGEDSVVNVWSFNGRLIRKIEAHPSGTIWAMDCDENGDYLVTGGSDSAVILINLEQEIDKLQIALNNEVPKKQAILRSKNLVVLSEAGMLFYYLLEKRKLELIAKHEELKVYSLLEVSHCRRLVALAGKYLSFMCKEELRLLLLPLLYQQNVINGL